MINWIAYIFFLALASAALIGVGENRLLLTLYPARTGTVGVCPSGGFRRCSYFVELFGDLHFLEHLASLLACLPFEVTSL